MTSLTSTISPINNYASLSLIGESPEERTEETKYTPRKFAQKYTTPKSSLDIIQHSIIQSDLGENDGQDQANPISIVTLGTSRNKRPTPPALKSPKTLLSPFGPGLTVPQKKALQELKTLEQTVKEVKELSGTKPMRSGEKTQRAKIVSKRPTPKSRK